MKKILLLILCFNTISNIQSQERVDKKKEIFSEQKSDTLKNATGWKFNNLTSEWVENKNVIYTRNSSKSQNDIDMGLAIFSKSQNFINLKFKTLNVDNEKYYILLVKKWTGAYKYPSIREDWYEIEEINAYGFSEEEYNLLKNHLESNTVSNKKIELKTEILVTLKSFRKDIPEENYPNLIIEEINRKNIIKKKRKKKKSKYSSDIIFPILKTESKNKEVVRFYIPSSYYKFDFEKEYFESSLDNFKKLIVK